MSTSANSSYQEHGYLWPLRCLQSTAHIHAEIVNKLDTSRTNKRSLVRRIKRMIGINPPDTRGNRHQDWPLIAELSKNEKVLEAVESVLGPNIVLWRSNIFCQYGTANDSIAWHRDVYGSKMIDQRLQTNVQISITHSTADNCMEAIPRSHVDLPPGVKDATRPNSAGNSHYEVANGVPVTSLVMSPGEFVIFDSGLIHRSSIATQSVVEPRVCVTLRYTVAGNYRGDTFAVR